MGANKVDILFVIDASNSMKPCFDKIKQNLRRFILPLNQASFDVRLGLLAYHSVKLGRNIGHQHFFLGGESLNLILELYKDNVNGDNYFTSNPERFLQALDAVTIKGDECTPMALDIASDFPFAPPDESRRVIILFTNEKLETGIYREKALEPFRRVLQKIAKRRIALYAYLPASRAGADMSHLPKSIIHSIEADDNCWDSLDFGQVLEQMGKSISASSLQMSREPEYEKAIYGQDKWVDLKGEADTTDRA